MTAEQPAAATTSNWVKVGASRATSPQTEDRPGWKPVPRKRRGKRSVRPVPRRTDDFDALRRRFEPEVQRSVDAFEVAVVLEAEGINDAEAERYGARDAFELARMLRTAAAEPATRVASPPRKDWYPPASISILRGFTFTVAALTVITVVELGAGSGAAALVLVVNVFGVAVMQAVAFLSYILLERSGAIGDPSVLRPLLFVLVLPLLVALVTAIVLAPVAGLFAGAALTYLIGTFMVLVLGRPVLVAVIVAPVALTATVNSLTKPADFLLVLTVGLWIIGAAVLVIASFVLTRSDGRRVVIRLGAVEFRAALPFAAASLTAGIVAIANLLMISGSAPLQHGGTRSWLIASLPFLIPVSLAEFLVVGVRRPLHQAIGRTSSPEEFRRLARRNSARMWARHMIVAAGVLAIVVPLLSDGALASRLLLGLSFLFLGTLLTATLLIASGDAIRHEQCLLGVTAALLIAARVMESTPGSQRLAVNLVILGVAAMVGVILSVRVTGTFARYR